MKYADMHMHSTHSDGCLSVKALFERAAEKGLSAITISDHDSYDSFEESSYYSEKFGIETLIATEISTWYKGRDVHILAYGFNPEYRMLKHQITQIRDDRKLRAYKMVEKLQRLMNVSIDFEDVVNECGDVNFGRPHIARVLISKGYAKDISDAFNKYLSDRSPAYVPKYRFPTERAIQVINNAGGVSVVAHMGRYFSLKTLDQFKTWGLLGVEIYHPSHNEDIRTQLLDYTEKNNMLCTGGSDFHEVSDYTDLGAQCVPYQYFDSIMNKVKVIS